MTGRDLGPRPAFTLCMTCTTMEGAVRRVAAISRNMTLPLAVEACRATVTAYVAGSSGVSLTMITEADKLGHTIPRFVA